MPNIRAYHESVASELDAVKNRIRSLVTHWASDGEWKESALRTVLRRYLPASTVVGRGFVVAREHSSTQIDLFVLKPDKPTLFRDGDLAVVTPDVPAAIAEVKTRVQGPADWFGVAKKLGEQGQFCKRFAGTQPWLGVFAYEGDINQSENILNAVSRVYTELGVAITCVSCGHDLFARFWPLGEFEPGAHPVAQAGPRCWRAYNLGGLSPAYFLSNLVDAICNVDRIETDYAWFALEDGKRPHMLAEKRVEEPEQRKEAPASTS